MCFQILGQIGNLLFYSFSGVISFAILCGAIFEFDNKYSVQFTGYPKIFVFLHFLLYFLFLSRHKIGRLHNHYIVTGLLYLAHMAVLSYGVYLSRGRSYGFTTALVYAWNLWSFRWSFEWPEWPEVVVVERHEEPAIRERHQTRILCVEGNICSGKTTLCRDFGEFERGKKKQSPVTHCHYEKVTTPLHIAFINNPEKYGFVFQMLMCERRVNLLQGIVQEDGGQAHMIDRSLLGDYAFCTWNFINGSIDEDDFDLYCEQFGDTPTRMFGKLIGRGDHVSLLVNLALAKWSLERLAKREGEDQQTPPEYMTGVSIMHMLALANILRHGRGLFKNIHINLEQKRLDSKSAAAIKNLLVAGTKKTTKVTVYGREYPEKQTSALHLDGPQSARMALVAKQLGINVPMEELDEVTVYEQVIVPALNS